MLVDKLREVYIYLGGTEQNPNWTKFDYLVKIATLQGIDVTDCVNSVEILRKLNENN